VIFVLSATACSMVAAYQLNVLELPALSNSYMLVGMAAAFFILTLGLVACCVVFVENRREKRTAPVGRRR